MLGLVSHSRQRWLVPIATSCVVAAIALVPGTFPARAARPDLPPRSAESLLLLLAASRANTLSGTVVESADLGLPELPSRSSSGGLNPAATLLTGSHTIRVWQSGSDRQRIAILDRLGESDVARRGSTVWTYQSRTNTTTLGTFDELAQNQIALTLLRDVLLPIVTGPDSVVTPGPTDRVAGQDAYTLLVRPKRPGSLVDRLELTIDAKQGTLLRFRVYAQDMSNPAFGARFISISYRPPAERLFAPVSGDIPSAKQTSPEPTPSGSTNGPGASPVSTIGYGWSAITKITTSNLARSMGSLFGTLTRPVPGGRAWATPLLSALITDSGDVYIGAVPLGALEAQARG